MKKILFGAIVFSFLSCTSDRLDVKTKALDFDLVVSRLDLDLANVKTIGDLKKVHLRYIREHEDFYNFYLAVCLRIGLSNDSTTLPALIDFINDGYIQKLHAEIKKEFGDLNKEIDQFKGGFSYLKYHLPEAALPKYIIFCNSLFTNSVVSSENTVGVGLERYLGAESPSIAELPEDPYYPYIKVRMDRRFMVRDMMMSWLGSNVLPEIQDQKELADVMIQWGKHFYVLEACFPKMEKALILRYFPEEYDWAISNEKEFWNFLVAQNSLFKRDYKMALNIFSDGPFTSGLPIEEKAPPRLGQFLGWRVVKKFMDDNPKISIKELIALDFKTILKSYN
jgi:hypothetical protein